MRQTHLTKAQASRRTRSRIVGVAQSIIQRKKNELEIIVQQSRMNPKRTYKEIEKGMKEFGSIRTMSDYKYGKWSEEDKLAIEEAMIYTIHNFSYFPSLLKNNIHKQLFENILVKQDNGEQLDKERKERELHMTMPYINVPKTNKLLEEHARIFLISYKKEKIMGGMFEDVKKVGLRIWNIIFHAKETTPNESLPIASMHDLN